ncbi:MAG: hypothetical protein PHG82_03605 [Candidatus Gracilibacteria bacterium]|nr:hypothetical protein [Candidatus Gracilibacteria bacterium]
MKIKQSILSGIAFSGTVLTCLLGFAAYSDLAHQDSQSTLTSTIWNEMIDKINSLGASLDSIDSRLTTQETKVIFYAERNTTTAAAVGNMLYDKNIINVGGGTYSQTTGVYTVPVTGIYKICFRTGYIRGQVGNRLQINGTNKLYGWTFRGNGTNVREGQLTDYTCGIYNITQGTTTNVYSEAASVLCAGSRSCSFSIEKID